MCDRETRLNFKWSHIAEGVSVAILIAIVVQVWDMRDYFKWSQEFHKNITPDFFYKQRWGYDDEMKVQAALQKQIQEHQAMADKRMTLIETQHLHVMDTLERIEKHYLSNDYVIK